MDVIGNGRYDSRCGPMSSTLRRLLANQVDILLAAKSLLPRLSMDAFRVRHNGATTSINSADR